MQLNPVIVSVLILLSVSACETNGKSGQAVNPFCILGGAMSRPMLKSAR